MARKLNCTNTELHDFIHANLRRKSEKTGRMILYGTSPRTRKIELEEIILDNNAVEDLEKFLGRKVTVDEDKRYFKRVDVSWYLRSQLDGTPCACCGVGKLEYRREVLTGGRSGRVVTNGLVCDRCSTLCDFGVTLIDPLVANCKCKYCGSPSGWADPNRLCDDCVETFGHKYYSEL